MSFGLRLLRQDGRILIDTDQAGGVYLGTLTVDGSQTTQFAIPASNLAPRLFKVVAGSHNITAENDGNGNIVVQFSSRTGKRPMPSTVLVFGL